MSLSRSVNVDKVLAHAQEHHAKRKPGSKSTPSSAHILSTVKEKPRSKDTEDHTPDYLNAPLPKFRLPSHGVSADIAYRRIHDELKLDGEPLLNLASFVHTQLDDRAIQIMTENMSKNLIDEDEYPASTEIHRRSVNMVAKLWHASDSENATGTATTGSSEAIQLGGLAMKRVWQARMIAEGKDERRPGPNIVLGANAQVALEKFARYFDVEARYVPVDESTNWVMDPQRAAALCDENTIGIFVILGSTYTGTYEDVAGVAAELDKIQADPKKGWNIPIHVDGASGGWFAPFATPTLVWDFRIPRVVSINFSAHKWGATAVGCGYVVWRDAKHLPKDMVFELHYLGSIEYSFSLNFSRPSAQVTTFYYLMVQKGWEGYRKVSLHDQKMARLFSRALIASKYYKVISLIHLKDPTKKDVRVNEGTEEIDYYTPGLPVVAFMFSDEFKKDHPSIEQRWIQTLLRAKGLIVPNYELPGEGAPEILRVVFRETFSEQLVEKLFADLIEVTEGLAKTGAPGHEVMKALHPAKSGANKATTHVGESVQSVGHDSIC